MTPSQIVLWILVLVFTIMAAILARHAMAKKMTEQTTEEATTKPIEAYANQPPTVADLYDIRQHGGRRSKEE